MADDENKNNSNTPPEREGRGPDRDTAYKEWKSKDLSDDDFNKAWDKARGNKGSPNWEAWDDVLESYLNKKKTEGLMEEGVDWEKIWELQMRQKRLFAEELYPESVQAAKGTAREYFDFISQLSDEANQLNIAKAWKMNVALADLTDVANKFYREQAAKGNVWGMRQAALLNKWAQEQNIESLNAVLPRATSTLEAYRETVEKYLEGDLPEDVIEEIQTASAEIGISQGRLGQALEMTTARNLGLSSLQLQQVGMQNVSALMNTALAMRAPVQMPQIKTDVSWLPTPQFPTAAYAQPYDPAQLQSAYLSGITQTSIVPPASYAQGAIQQYQTQLEYLYSKEMSALNYQMFQEQMRLARQQNWWNLGFSLLGAGAALGAAKLFG